MTPSTSYDYTVHKYLQIIHSKGISYIDLGSEQHCLCDCMWSKYIDSDDEESLFDKEYEENYKIHFYYWIYKKYILEPKPPIMIYAYNRYLKESYKEKYEERIKNKIACGEPHSKDVGLPLETLENITKINKIEYRR